MVVLNFYQRDELHIHFFILPFDRRIGGENLSIARLACSYFDLHWPATGG